MNKNSVKELLMNAKETRQYLHLQDFIERTGITREQLNILISIGAFRFTGKTKKALLWEATALLKHRNFIAGEQPIFDEPPVEFELPELHDHPVDNAYDELESLDFPCVIRLTSLMSDPYKFQLSKDLA